MIRTGQRVRGVADRSSRRGRLGAKIEEDSCMRLIGELAKEEQRRE